MIVFQLYKSMLQMNIRIINRKYEVIVTLKRRNRSFLRFHFLDFIHKDVISRKGLLSIDDTKSIKTAIDGR